MQSFGWSVGGRSVVHSLTCSVILSFVSNIHSFHCLFPCLFKGQLLGAVVIYCRLSCISAVYIFVDNWKSQYLKKDEVSPGVKAGEYQGEVRSDISTSFFILLAIFFPSVTGR